MTDVLHFTIPIAEQIPLDQTRNSEQLFINIQPRTDCYKTKHNEVLVWVFWLHLEGFLGLSLYIHFLLDIKLFVHFIVAGALTYIQFPPLICNASAQAKSFPTQEKFKTNKTTEQKRGISLLESNILCNQLPSLVQVVAPCFLFLLPM